MKCVHGSIVRECQTKHSEVEYYIKRYKQVDNDQEKA